MWPPAPETGATDIGRPGRTKSDSTHSAEPGLNRRTVAALLNGPSGPHEVPDSRDHRLETGVLLLVANSDTSNRLTSRQFIILNWIDMHSLVINRNNTYAGVEISRCPAIHDHLILMTDRHKCIREVKLAGKTLFITGASRGIGKVIALKAARDGANVVIAAKTAEPHPKLSGTIYTAAEESLYSFHVNLHAKKRFKKVYEVLEINESLVKGDNDQSEENISLYYIYEEMTQFGNPVIIAERTIQNLLRGTSIKGADNINELYAEMQSAKIVMDSLNRTSELDGQNTMLNIVKRIKVNSGMQPFSESGNQPESTNPSSSNEIAHNVSSETSVWFPVVQLDVNGHKASFKHLRNLPLEVIRTGSVDLLLGSNLGDILKPLEVRYSERKNEPYAIRTALGWYVCGTTGSSFSKIKSKNFVYVTNKQQDNPTLIDFKALWNVDQDIGQDIYESADDNVFHASKFMADRRLKSLVKRLNKHGLYKIYNEEVETLLKEGFAEHVVEKTIPQSVWYIPHHFVPKKGNKIRIVYDCAAQVEGRSINTEVLQGPDLNNTLLGVLLRFRLYPFAAMGDIEAMYMQVKVPPSQRDLIRFLWCNSDGSNIKSYRMTSHIFGGVWSPAAALFALQHSSFQSLQQMETVVNNVVEHLGGFGFNLRDILFNVSEVDRQSKISFHGALGLKWHNSADMLSIVVKSEPSEPKLEITKRSILSTVAGVFDPLGLTSPVVLKGRIILQEVVLSGVDWDEPLSSQIVKMWSLWLLDLQNLSKVEIPRCVFYCQGSSLHNFVDANIVSDPTDLEVKHTAHLIAPVEDSFSELVERISSYTKLRRIVGYILRFSKCCKKLQPGTTVEILQLADHVILRQAQISIDPTKLKSLDLILENELYRVGGRISKTYLPSKQIYVPDGAVAKLLVLQAHQLMGHMGVNSTLSELRQRYWISRSIVKSVVYNCSKCKILKGTTSTQKMSNIPEERLGYQQSAFYYTGLDIFGPFMITRKRSSCKAWGLLLTCMTTRAIHLEKLEGLDTSSFLNGLERFFSRRGLPKKITCDNAPNFKRGQKELQAELHKLNSEGLTQKLANANIEFSYIPPYSSHFGGVYERQIRTVRQVLQSMLFDQQFKVTDDVMNTFFCQVEAIVNTRPISPLHNRSNDEPALRPIDFLVPKCSIASLPIDASTVNCYTKAWKRVHAMLDCFWRRWLRSYLPLLQQRSKWWQKTNNQKIGDIVLVVDPNAARADWKLGKVTSVKFSEDGLVRSVEVLCHGKIITRPITKLVNLEIV
ncbi:Hydroxysteroid dehydrogenase-like protein 2 [Nymphon striatum]|nr:Hydroxysteroid dehydrogenase-like protein 2 [Nymphon striatum]